MVREALGGDSDDEGGEAKAERGGGDGEEEGAAVPNLSDSEDEGPSDKKVNIYLPNYKVGTYDQLHVNSP